MTDISVHYYNSGWVDLTGYVTKFDVDDQGINAIPKATVNLESSRSNLSTFLSNPYRLIRIQASPSGTYPIFLGKVDNCFTKTVTGTITERTKLSLDCFSYGQRLANDYITYDYYKAQSAISPLEDSNAFSYRDMINGFLTIPDSARDGTGLSSTGFTLDADVDAAGIDAIIDGSCNWQRQSLFEAVRIVCDHIGYDGYFPCYTSESYTPTIKLAPFDKANAATINDPLINEPQYEYGSLNDVANVVFGWGGHDEGIPSDGDRFTEYGVDKYSPAAWTGSIWQVTSLLGAATIEDVDNTILTETIRVNGKCVKAYTTNASADVLRLNLSLANTEYGSVDAENRITGVTFNLKVLAATNEIMPLRVWLGDGSGNVIKYNVNKGRDYVDGSNIVGVPSTFESTIYISMPSFDSPIEDYSAATDRWMQATGSSFDLSDIVSMVLELFREPTTATTDDWGLCVDGLQFTGGYAIEPFQWYSETLCPPLKDASSISTYGVHPIHLQDATISSFEAMQAEKARVLANLKTPNPILSFTKAAPEATQIYPSYVINTAYRVIGIKYQWDSMSKQCKTTYRCVGKLKPLPPIWTQVNELRFLVK